MLQGFMNIAWKFRVFLFTIRHTHKRTNIAIDGGDYMNSSVEAKQYDDYYFIGLSGNHGQFTN